MSLVGRAALLLAFAAALFAVAAALWSRRPGERRWQLAAERSVYAVFGLMSVGMLTMWAALLTDDFGLRNVADYSSSTLGWPFKISALWGSQAGSLMLWAWMLSLFSAIAVFVNRRRHRELMPIVVAVLMAIAVFFTSVLSFVTSPFETLAVAPAEGRGLNPLLQNGYMMIHPPMLYVGYVGLAVPFAFGIAALWTRRLDSEWIGSVRRWTIVAWLFLGLGILLGARWAYEELGWGGYWAWDPVENAAFMPWLVATAFLHSIMVQERRGMLKVWNMVLVALTFSLCVFGTFLTRSGVLSSVHAFGESTLGPYFLGFIIVVLAGSFALIITRLPALKSQNQLESYVSREAVFLYNNLLLVGLAFAVFWGTIFPILSEAVRGSRITVGAGFYEQVALPIGVALLFLTGVGPLVSWRKASPAQLRRRFLGPLIAAAASVPLVIWVAEAFDHWVAGVVFVIAVFTTACIVSEFWRGTKVRHALGGVSWVRAFGQLFARNRRRYGGYVVHLGVVVLIVGLAGSKSFASQGDLALQTGQRGEVAGYTFVNEGGRRGSDDHKMSVGVRVGVFKDGQRVDTLDPAVNVYRDSMQRSTEVAIASKWDRDIYVVLVGLTPSGLARMSVFINPLVGWIWAAGLIIALGALIAVWPTPKPSLAGAPEAARGGAAARD